MNLTFSKAVLFFLLALFLCVTLAALWNQHKNYVQPFVMSKESIAKSEKYCHTINLHYPFVAPYECVDTKTTPSFKICIHDVAKDRWVSGSIKQNGVWEGGMINKLQELFSRYTTAGLIDIGANIGMYSLLAAKMGRPVLAVEPFQDSYQRLHRSIWINQLQEKVTLVINPISNVRVLGKMNLPENFNQGSADLRYENCENNCTGIKTILMSDLLEVINFKSAIMKVDIQGHEARAFQTVEAILDRVYVPYIFMEWDIMKSYFVSPSHMSPMKNLTLRLLDIFSARKYKPFAGSELNYNSWHTWPFDIVWRHEYDLGPA